MYSSSKYNGWSVVVSFACELTLLFFVVLVMVRGMDKLEVSLFINWIPNKWRQMDISRQWQKHVFDRTCVYAWEHWPEDKGIYPQCQGQNCSAELTKICCPGGESLTVTRTVLIFFDNWIAWDLNSYSTYWSNLSYLLNSGYCISRAIAAYVPSKKVISPTCILVVS